MDIEIAKEVLKDATRVELRDHAFGDTEVSWILDGNEIAGGYFGGRQASVWINTDITHASFDGDEARKLRDCGILGKVERNDETGPEEYKEGAVMPGLTPEGVLKELTGDDNE